VSRDQAGRSIHRGESGPVAAFRSAGARVGDARHPRQHHRAGVCGNGAQSRFPRLARRRVADEARGHAAIRQAGGSRWRAAPACVGRGPLHDRKHDHRRRRSLARMAIDFSLTPDVEALRARIARLVRARIIPLEADRANYDEHENIALPVLERIRAEVKAQGMWAPQVPRALGGLGLSVVGRAACYEEMNASIFGPACFNCAAPDDGNMTVLAKVATPAQQARWLAPIVEGLVRSAFVMTEPHPGSGSDPMMMLTRAERRGGDWIVHGRKWVITGAAGPQHFILIAKTSDDPRKGLSAFMFDRDQPGWRIVRRIPIMGPEEHGGHCEIEFDGLEIPDADRLMNGGDGLKY